MGRIHIYRYHCVRIVGVPFCVTVEPGRPLLWVPLHTLAVASWTSVPRCSTSSVVEMKSSGAGEDRGDPAEETAVVVGHPVVGSTL